MHLYRFEGKVNSLTIGKIELERTPEDTQIDEISHYILQLEKHVLKVVKQSECLVKASR
jgi:hypothetical protein